MLGKHLRIGDLAKQVGVNVSAIRYYEKEGFIKAKRDSYSNYRLFDVEDVDTVRFIKKAQYFGFSLDQIKSFLSERENGNSPSAKVREIAQKRVEDIEAEIKRLDALKAEILESIINDPNDSPPDAKEICLLIDKARC